MDSQKSDICIIEEKISKVSGETHVKRYQKGKLLGKGGFAKCFEITNLENKKILAAKIIPKASLTKNRARQKLISEIKIHKSLHHIHVVQFEHVFEDSENVYILLELCPNQTLNELIKRRKRLVELEVQCFIMQIINSLKYLHNNRVIHRDLKLGNLFINEKMELKLGDFGLATKLEFEGEKKRTICGTPNYIAPEILDGKTGHSYEVDVWSLGVIMYTLLIGKPPFETPDVKTTYKKIRMNSYSFPEHVPISDTSRALIQKILHLDPSRRPTIDEMAAHPFLNNGGTIPRVLPSSILNTPPSSSYIKQFSPMGNQLRVNQQPQRLQDSQSSLNLPKSLSKDRNNLISTDKGFGKQDSKNSNWGMNTGSNWSKNLQNSQGGRPLTQQKQPGTSSTKNLPNNGSQMFNTQSNLQSIQSMNALGRGNQNLRGSLINSNKNETWVKSWVDYSSKYGLGYLLSNGNSGVFFNDSTKIVLEASGVYFQYMERRQSDRQDVMTCHTLKDYPKELQKKITLLQHFRSYLEGEKAPPRSDQGSNANDVEGQSQPLVYVKKWMKTRHAIMFRLSNKIVQVNFTDKTEILLSSENKQVTYVNKKGERSNYPLATALESQNSEMSKRLKYTKEILTHMLNQNNQRQQQTEKE